MKVRIAEICTDYMDLRIHGKPEEARKLLESLSDEEFKWLYSSSLEYLKNTLYDDALPYILVNMSRQLFIEHEQETDVAVANDITCQIIDGFIYHLVMLYKDHLVHRHPSNSFAEQLAKDQDPEVAAVGREILAGGRN